MRSRTCSDPKEPAMNTSWPLASRRVLLTGGLGSLGQAQARRLRADGADVHIFDLPSPRGAALAVALNQEAGPGMGPAGLDRRDVAGAQSAVGAREREQGSFDILINNGALIPHKPFEEFSLAE